MFQTKAKKPRASRMAVRRCLSCASDTLVSNGGFWDCRSCGFAVTSMALTKDLQQIAMLEEAAIAEQGAMALVEETCRPVRISMATSRG